ncbi:putative lipase atg15 [Mortierella antarctica]|nr:putative lipase atg15 [Mortierella antarctica]
MTRRNSLAFLPLLALYILVLAHISPTVHPPLTLAHPSPRRSPQQPGDSSLPLDQSNPRQIPFTSHHSHARYPNNAATVLVAGEELPQETLSLRHMLHHGGARYPGLFKRKDFSQGDLQASEQLTGEPLSHRVKVKATRTLKPRDQSYRNQGFRTLDMSIGPESWTRQVIAAPDVRDKETILQLAKINYNSYTEVASPGWYDLEGHWTVAILWTVEDMYPDANVWLTGHSLGGGLSALLGLTFGVPTVTFEMPGDRLAAQRLHLPMPPAINWDDMPLFHVGHTADPVFQGVCNGPTSACYYSGFAMESKCHTGRTCVYDPVGENSWKVDIRTHRLADSIEGVYKVKETVPECKAEENCIDCEAWTYE